MQVSQKVYFYAIFWALSLLSMYWFLNQCSGVTQIKENKTFPVSLSCLNDLRSINVVLMKKNPYTLQNVYELKKMNFLEPCIILLLQFHSETQIKKLL